MNEYDWLMRWYRVQCDGEWEHEYGIEIGTLDNPGWSLKIDLRGTALEGRAWDGLSFNIENGSDDPDSSWYSCSIKDLRYEGYGGTRDLANLIRVFREWAESAQD